MMFDLPRFLFHQNVAKCFNTSRVYFEWHRLSSRPERSRMCSFRADSVIPSSIQVNADFRGKEAPPSRTGAADYYHHSIFLREAVRVHQRWIQSYVLCYIPDSPAGTQGHCAVRGGGPGALHEREGIEYIRLIFHASGGCKYLQCDTT